jgi:sugar lactone lactonase YvrE
LRQDAASVKDQSGNLLAITFLHGVGLAPQTVVYPGRISTFAGNGSWAYVDASSPVVASFRNPAGIAIDTLGNAYIADSVNQVIRKVAIGTGVVSTVVGNGVAGYAGDGGSAGSARLNNPTGVAVDAAGDLFIADQGNNVIRKVTAGTQVITTIAGGGITASGTDGIGDGGLATAALLYGPQDVAVDATGNLYIADSYHRMVREVNPMTGIITVVAGGGTAAGTDGLGDGGLAIAAQLSDPSGIALDSSGNLYIADTGHSLVRVVNMTSGMISVVAGNGNYGYAGDGGPASSAALAAPMGVRLDTAGNVYIADFGNNVVRQVQAVSHKIATIAGSGAAAYAGDGNVPTSAALANPASIALDSAGNLYIADYSNNVIRRVSFAPPALTFPSEAAGSISPAQAVAFSNIGNQSLTFHRLTVDANFQQQASGGIDCSSSSVVVSGSACSVALVFAPASSGNLTGTLTVGSNSMNLPGSSQAVNLSGVGTGGAAPTATLNTTSLTFGNQGIGTSSSAQTATLSNAGAAALSISSIWLSGMASSEFGLTTTCGASLAASASCTVFVTFKPGVVGARSASVTFADNAVGSPQTVALSGTGISAAGAMRFIPVTPCRIADTRNAIGPFGGPMLTAGSARNFVIPNSSCNIPTTALAYSLNVAVVPAGPGYITIWPSGQSQPLVSTLNSDGRVKAAAAIAAAGAGGAISVYSSNNTAVILDITGYFVSATNSSALAFYPITPCRVADTRQPALAPYLSAAQPRNFSVLSNSCGVPSSAQAYSLNFAAIPRTVNGGYLTAWATGQAQPLTSALNFANGVVTANAAIVPAGANGNISIYASGDIDLVIDINGYFALPATSALSLYSLPPCRVLDTRLPAGSLPFSGAVSIGVVASGCNVPSSAQAYLLSAAVVPSGGLGYLVLWPNGGPQPLAATLNAADGAVTSNMAIVPTSNGAISAFATSSTHLILDIYAYFGP